MRLDFGDCERPSLCSAFLYAGTTTGGSACYIRHLEHFACLNQLNSSSSAGSKANLVGRRPNAAYV